MRKASPPRRCSNRLHSVSDSSISVTVNPRSPTPNTCRIDCFIFCSVAGSFQSPFAMSRSICFRMDLRSAVSSRFCVGWSPSSTTTASSSKSANSFSSSSASFSSCCFQSTFCPGTLYCANLIITLPAWCTCLSPLIYSFVSPMIIPIYSVVQLSAWLSQQD